MPLQFHLLDLQKLNSNWEFFQHDSLTFDTTYLPKLDLLFIDSLHTRLQLDAELALYSPLIRKKGFIVLHDVKEEILPQMFKAFQVFISKYDFRNFWYYPNNNGLGVIQVE